MRRILAKLLVAVALVAGVGVGAAASATAATHVPAHATHVTTVHPLDWTWD